MSDSTTPRYREPLVYPLDAWPDDPGHWFIAVTKPEYRDIAHNGMYPNGCSSPYCPKYNPCTDPPVPGYRRRVSPAEINDRIELAKAEYRQTYASERFILAVRRLWLSVKYLFAPTYCRKCSHDWHPGRPCDEGHGGYWVGPTYIEADGCLCGNPEFD